MIKLIILDLDGTLVDSLADLTDAVNYMRSQYGLHELLTEEVRKLVGEGAGRLVERALPGFSPEALKQGLEHFFTFNFRHIADKSALYPGVIWTLEQLKERGYILAVASNKSEPLCREILRVLGADHFFAAILGAESAAARKPSPEPVLHLMALFGVNASETVMVGDSGYDIAAGKGAGVLTIACDYGYGAAEELKGADRIVASLGEIIPFVITPPSPA
jgi:phosphoglycolate phosphatase